MTVREAIRASLGLLDRRDRRLLGLAVAVQIATALLDLLGVLLIGAVGALSLANVNGQSPPRRVTSVVSALGLGDLSGNALVAILAGAAAALLLTKSLVSPLLLARVFRFLARREAGVSARLAKGLLSRPLTFIHQRSSQQRAIALIDGVNSAVVSVLGQTVVGISEAALLALLAAVLMFANPVVALGAVFYFILVGFGLHKILGNRSGKLGAQRMTTGVASLSAVQEALGTYRELTVSDRRSLYVARIQELRRRQAEASAGIQMISILPKYISEGALVLGAFALAGALFTTQPIAVAAGTFALFIAAATRVMPSLLRLQTATLTIRSAAGAAALTFALAEDLGYPLDSPQTTEVHKTIQRALSCGYPDFDPTIELCDVTFTYPEAPSPAVQRISVKVRVGESVAFVGSTGAGKSTVADLILGVLQPDVGEVKLGGLAPADAVERWPGGLAYVPQNVVLVNDSVRANVTLGLPRDVVDDALVWDALGRAELAHYVDVQPAGLDTQIGEHGLRLSGGQRQRLGIARALFTRPRLLVLDEATSALDAETEHAIANMLEDLDADVTKVIIAHRLSTIRNADLVVYLEDGEVLAQGTFDQVLNRVPALRRQAALMGLRPE
jgi:ABC-type multidrug transport system fused ATPase/permease subunit